MPGPAVASIGGSIIGGIGQASAAKKAAAAQTAAANQDIKFQRETRDLIRNDLAQYRTGGGIAQSALDFELGLGARPMIGGGTAPQIEEFTEPGGMQPNAPYRGATNSDGRPSNPGGAMGQFGPSAYGTPGAGAGMTKFRVNGQTFGSREEAQAYANANTQGGTPYGGFTKTPGYDFRLQQGQSSLEAGAAARGGLNSGAAMRDLLKFGQDYGSNEYGNYLSRLGARADTGMAAANMSGQASQAAAGNISNALGDRGNAISAGYVGVGNAINSGVTNALGAWNYQNNLRQPTGYGGGR